MLRKILQFFSFALIYIAMPASAMEFKSVGTGGNCAGCYWIAAEGTITNSTPDDFERFLRLNKLDDGSRQTINFDSPGGSLFGGIELGKIIRSKNFATTVGRSVKVEEVGLLQIYETQPGKCMSACAFAFLGGVTRYAKAAEIGIHQFYREYAISNPTSKMFDAQDLQSQQAITGLLVSYTSSMGVDPSFIATSASTPPSSMYFLTQQDLINMKIINDEDQFGPWSIKANSTKIFLESKTQNNQKEAYIICGNDKQVRLSVFNQDFIKYSVSFESFSRTLRDLQGIQVFWTDLPKRSIRPVKSNGIPGIELTFPTNFPQMIRPNQNFGGMNAYLYASNSVMWMFQYKLSYENLQNGLAAIYRSCGA